MFLQSVVTKNPRLVEAAVALHQQNKVPAGSYVLDLDTIRANAAKIVGEARACGLKVFAMTKQVSRNPAMLRVLREEAVDGCVCVDMDDARAVFASGLRIGHLGHLVQVPKAEVAAAVSMKPMFWTVYSLDKAREISEALPEGQTQEILLRVYEEGNTFYTGHEGGFPVEELDSVIEALQTMPGLRFAGFTTFPTQLFNHTTKQVSTPATMRPS
jgi:predicted amino acid racemase